MGDHLYVATGPDGVEHGESGDVVWGLPHVEGDTVLAGETTTATDAPLVLRRAASLLDALDERVFVAEPPAKPDESEDSVTASSARLVKETSWSTEAAARFAIDCAEHALAQAPRTRLPDGSELTTVVAKAKELLDSTSDEDEHLGLLARLAAVRRLRRLRSELSDASLDNLVDDLDVDTATLNDPAWTTLAACSEAVLAALEALRHLVMPRYVHAREETVDEHDSGKPLPAPQVLTTPWGPFAIGATARSPYEPAWAEARDAALRAREAARDRGGEDGEREERAYQAGRLESALETAT